MKDYKAYTIDATGRIAALPMEAASKREAKQIIEAGRPELTVMCVFEINEAGSIIA